MTGGNNGKLCEGGKGSSGEETKQVSGEIG
jgi:hypothetical protein